jgi:hypothetical protein
MRLREHPGITEGRIDILFVKPSDLTIEEGYNIRDLTTPQARQELDELKTAIKDSEAGVHTPLKVRFDGANIIVVEGHRRHMAVMELIAEHVASEGTEGRAIEAVPIYAEAKGTTALDRDFGLRHSNSGVPLKPLEFANLIYRTIHQRGISEKEAAKGFGISVTVLRNHLAMRAMPDTVKEHVRKDEISATLAAKIVKGADPKFAEELIAANLAENKKINGKRAKVTAKSLKRDKEKKGGDQNVIGGPKTAPAAEPTPVSDTARPLEDSEGEGGSTFSGEEEIKMMRGRDQHGRPVSMPWPKAMKYLIDALEPFARCAELYNLNERGEDDEFEVPVRDIKRAWLAYTAAVGESS